MQYTTTKNVSGDFQTPTDVATYMVSMLTKKTGRILEPTPGQWNIVNALIRAGYRKIAAPTDYWELDKNKRYDGIVANLPFSTKSWFNAPEKYLNKGMVCMYDQIPVLMGMTDNLILLVPWFTMIDSDRRTRMFKDYGLISVTILPRKTFAYSRIQCCILRLQKNYTGESIFKFYNYE